MYDFNLLVSYDWGTFAQTKNEIDKILKKIGDDNPVIQKTLAKGICGIKTKLDNREVVKKVKEIYKQNAEEIYFSVKWVLTIGVKMSLMKGTVDKIKKSIQEDEKWAMEVEKRRFLVNY
jgi:hypothetical protein